MKTSPGTFAQLSIMKKKKIQFFKKKGAPNQKKS